MDQRSTLLIGVFLRLLQTIRTSSQRLSLRVSVSVRILCIPTRTHLTYNNDKPWFTAKLRQLHQAKREAYRKGDKVLYKQVKYTLEKEIRVAKRNYSDKLRIQFSSGDSSSVWKGMKDITSYKTPSPSTLENQQQADDLNEFYCRFEKIPHTCPEHLSKQPLTPPATPLSPTPAIQISEDEVCQVFRKQNRKKLQAQTVSYQVVWNPVLTSWPPTNHWNCAKCLHASNAPPYSPSQRNYRTKWLQACGSNVCGHEIIWKTGAGPLEGQHWTLAGYSSVCLQSKRFHGRYSQHGTALCSATSRQTRGLCEDPVYEL